MRKKICLLPITFIFIFSYQAYPQQNKIHELRWIDDLRTSPMLMRSDNYTELPQQSDRISNVTTPRIIQSGSVTYIISPNIRVHPNESGTQSETIIERHPENAFKMFASANTFGNQGLSTGTYLTSNGGLTWYGNDTLIGTSGDAIFNYGDPGPTINKNGVFILTYISIFERMASSFSTDNGYHWSSTFTIPGSSSFPDKNLATSDDDPYSPYYGRSYIIFNEFAGPNLYRVVNSYTTNDGISWVQTRLVSPYPSPNHYHQGSDIATGPGGVVYAVWGNNFINGSSGTEDSLGFARSINGGANWIYSTNGAIDMNGIRTTNLFNGIRANGFPRIDIDKTACGPRRGTVYVVTTEKYLAPAEGPSDIVLNTSSDQGSTWIRTKVNQNSDTADIEYFPAIKVDETGDLNIVYYSTRNSVNNTQAEVFLSRSSDGGVTFHDILISEQPFTPVQIPGTSGGYQGDYIGITSSNGKVWPVWAENGVTGRYQIWSSTVNVTGKVPCLSSNKFYIQGDFKYQFPPDDMYISYCENKTRGEDCQLYFERKIQSAYGSDTGSAMFNSFDAPAGTIQSIISYTFEELSANMYLTFDEAYAPNSDSGRGTDSLIIESSSDGGNSFITIASLHGSVSGGSLNTSAPTNLSFVPSNSSWASKTFLLPAGTNKIQMKFISGHGNNIYVDNIKIRELPPVVSSTFRIAVEGLYRTSINAMIIHDTARFYLHRVDFPNVIVDSSAAILDSASFIANPVFVNAQSGFYYLRVVHRNSIETWSKTGGESYNRGTNFNHNFFNNASNTFGSNVKQVDISPPRYAIFSGDVNQDGNIDASDFITVFNDAGIFKSGYQNTDLTGDYIVDIEDVMLAYNNAKNFIAVMSPLTNK